MDKPKLADLLIDPKMGSGAFFTPAAALESIKKIMDATKTVVEQDRERGKNLMMPRGIEMQRFVASDRTVRFVGQYRKTCATAGPASRPVRMYEIKVAPRTDSDGWYACIREDDKDIAYLDSMFSRNTVERMALGVLKNYLRYRDRRNARKALRRKRAKELKAEDGAE